MKRPKFEHATGLTALLLFALFAAFSTVSAKKGGNGNGGGGGNPGGGGGEDPPPNPAPIEYQLTWFPGLNSSFTRIYDINDAGVAVGSYHDETGTRKAFWATADGVINPLENWWVFPPGYEDWKLEGSELQINNARDVCGIIENVVTGDEELFLADLLDVNSLEPLGPVPGNSQWLHMNENGDVAFMGSEAGGTGWSTFLYVRSLNTIYSFGQDYPGLKPTGINDSLQVSLISSENPDATGLFYHGSARLTFDPSDESAVVEDLGIAQGSADPVTLSWGGINNAGTVFGCYETSVTSRRNRRNGNARAGFIADGAGSWTELDASLPTGSSLYIEQVQSAACVLSVNEFGQAVGGYESIGHRSEDLWLLDPEDGLFDLNNLVVGNATDVDAFRAANAFRGLHITDLEPATGYGIISGYDVFADAAFILTPVPVTP